MNHFTNKCMHDHRNPIVKVNLPTRKLFLGPKNEEEKKLVYDHQEHFKTILEHQRIEKRSGRAQAIWLPENNIAKVIKVVKNLVKNFGFQNKDGVYLYPEEMLFLLETNRLEVTFNSNVLTIEEAYETVFKATNISLSKYRIYKKLALLGYQITRFEQTDSKILNRAKKNNKKRSIEEKSHEMQISKKIKEAIPIEAADDLSSDCGQLQSENNPNCSHREGIVPKEADHIVSNILNRIRKIMPKDNFNDYNYLKPDYCIFSPTNLQRVKPDFNLHVCEDVISEQRNFNFKLPRIFASCTDDVAFYKFSNVHLPYI